MTQIHTTYTTTRSGFTCVCVWEEKSGGNVLWQMPQRLKTIAMYVLVVLGSIALERPWCLRVGGRCPPAAVFGSWECCREGPEATRQQEGLEKLDRGNCTACPVAPPWIERGRIGFQSIRLGSGRSPVVGSHMGSCTQGPALGRSKKSKAVRGGPCTRRSLWWASKMQWLYIHAERRNPQKFQ
jgi:hypothetical protein